MQVALDLPAGLVDQIIGGHVHQRIAHEVNGIAIISNYSDTRTFGRVDHVFDRADHSFVSRKIFPPQPICGYVDNTSGDCIAAREVSGAAQVAHYSGRVVSPNSKVIDIADYAAQRAFVLKSEKLGVRVETPITRAGGTNSAIGHLFTDIVLDAIGGDVVIHNVVGGIRADLAQGDLTYGDIYEMSPFDNIIVQLDLTGAELRRVLEHELLRSGRRVVGVSGIRVFAACEGDKLNVTMTRADGSEIGDDEMLAVMTTDYLAYGGSDVFSSIIPEDGFPIDMNQPMVREVVVDWMRQYDGNLNADSFSDADNPKWNIPEPLPTTCSL